ncbi:MULTISPECIES: DUF4332 domain-containing protein [Methanobacterium]|jgi:hypothetical protein|uniref:DUF4332 domain-containing protein n=1 Tax=Methanobacterium veterum TaxID=408577 RepID=A0A9E5A4L8_9EURY|nr:MULTISPECIES: DUF4332 domain-containing protein [Methanobacterium]MCZ3365928.1 DUF4332 domain-containing protein [Methanobacterium veterum]MCZ3371393.1 DUF4332 domain-containing protein [Methanobacterium veterum]
MVDDYYIDLEKYPLIKFKQELTEADLLPSRKILKEQIDTRFKILESKGIKNLSDLSTSLKTPKKAKEFAERSGLPQDYILILRREVNSYLPKPVHLEKFPGIEKDTLNKLNSKGIKNTAHLFKIIKTQEDRAKLAAETKISPEEILELTKLTDLSRVKWIGPIFARMFLDSGTDTVKKLSNADAKALYGKLIQINNEKRYTKGRFIESDVELCIKVSKMVPMTIIY